MGMGDALRVKEYVVGTCLICYYCPRWVKLLIIHTCLFFFSLCRSELVYFFSQLEQLKEHSAVLNRSTEDARNLDLLRINAIEKKGLNLMEAVQLQSTRVNELLDHYEAAVKRMSCFFVKWDCIVSAKEKELMLYC